MANRQQKQAAKAVRRKGTVAAKRQADRQASSLPARVALAAASPTERCLRTASMDEDGIAHVVLARRLPSGTLGCGFLLVDLLCLGVKDAYYREMAPSDLDGRLAELDAAGQAMVDIDPASAKKLILGAVAFAAGNGMDPAADYRRVIRLFDGINTAAAIESFTYGRDGKAVYIPGPNDGPARMREVERRLLRARGEDGWDVDIPQRDRQVMQNIADLLGRGREVEDGPIIDHEGPAEAVVAADGATISDPPGAPRRAPARLPGSPDVRSS